MKKWRPLNKKIIISVLLILSFIINCGAFFSPTYVELDPEGKPSYRCIEMSEVISAVDREEFTDKYKEKFYRIYGTVRKIRRHLAVWKAFAMTSKKATVMISVVCIR